MKRRRCSTDLGRRCRIGIAFASLCVAVGTAAIIGTASASAAVVAPAARARRGESTASGTLSPSQFAKKGSAICMKGGKQIGALFGATNMDPSMLSAAKKQALFKKVLAISQRQVRQIGALKAPPDVAGQLRTTIQGANETLRSVQAAGADAFFADESDPFETINAQLVALGMSGCASGG